VYGIATIASTKSLYFLNYVINVIVHVVKLFFNTTTSHLRVLFVVLQVTS